MCHPDVPPGQPTPAVERVDVAVPLRSGEHMPALLTRPPRGRGAAVLVVNDIFGRSPFYENIAARLSAASFHALCPEFFFREGPLGEETREAALARRGRLDENQTLADLVDCVDWLRTLPDVTGDRVGTVGFCMGGTFVLDLASLRQDLATVCYYGFPAGLAGSGGTGVVADPPLTRTDAIGGPIIGFWGDQDAAVGMANVERFADELAQRNVDFTYSVYPGLGHGFLGQSQLDPASDFYAAANDSWQRALDFLTQHV
jgi:carboxymethylenebutenolidase